MHGDDDASNKSRHRVRPLTYRQRCQRVRLVLLDIIWLDTKKCRKDGENRLEELVKTNHDGGTAPQGAQQPTSLNRLGATTTNQLLL